MTLDEQINFMELIKQSVKPLMQGMCDEVIESLHRIKDLEK